MTTPAKPLRAQMPLVAALLDDLGHAFGHAEIGGRIRAGLRGAPVFWAQEGGQTLGTPSTPAGVELRLTQLVLGSNADVLKRGRA